MPLPSLAILRGLGVCLLAVPPLQIDAPDAARYRRLVFARIEKKSPPSVFNWAVR